MTTESWSPRSRGLDAWPVRDVLDAFLDGQLAGVAAVRAAMDEVERAADGVAGRLAAGGRLAYAGAGTSGRLAVQDGVELTPTFNWPQDRLVFLLAGGDTALSRAVEGAEDDTGAAEVAVDAADLGPADALIALSASGATPFTVAAVKRARARGTLTVGAANNPGTSLLTSADLPIALITGAEAIAGSTRMKAGTAQRALLTVLSSAVMVRLGRVHDGLMVDVRATNAKLVRRSLRMLQRLTDCDEAAARAALDAAGGNVKHAVLVLHGMAPQEAAQALAAAGGHLRAALATRG